MNRDLVHWASAKLAGEWSAASLTGALTAETLDALLVKFSSLDPLVRVRLLLAAMSLDADARRDRAVQLSALASAARADEDEWVRLLGKAVGEFDGVLHLEAIEGDNAVVAQTIERLLGLLAKQENEDLFRPREEALLQPAVLQSMGQFKPATVPAHSHFKLRASGVAPPGSRTLAGSTGGARRTGSGALTDAKDGGDGLGAPDLGGADGKLEAGSMFRSARPEFKKPVGSAMGGRPGAMGPMGGTPRRSKAKTLDVNDLTELSRQRAAAKALEEAAASGWHAEATAGQDGTPKAAKEGMPSEDAAVGGGEPEHKRQRMADGQGGDGQGGAPMGY